jgi:hypothetical protein
MIRVDRIEGQVAVVELDSHTIDLPLALLPPGTKEGSVLKLVLDVDSETARRARAQARQDRLAAQSELPDEIEL